eukprot:CAMPEP_0114976250 /NCGR_PEP_ID=MMETSP0216-20121206/2564_1 /TAXON_ID=223996 /ORGANISM="Protocruzia adherens, Strain Boccale" /LENGTH=588 /DNA_ID=CAMNT_0002337149 /DNA_START=51 /DNA_END=1819 /DNA_ORIENTATION=+
MAFIWANLKDEGGNYNTEKKCQQVAVVKKKLNLQNKKNLRQQDELEKLKFGYKIAQDREQRIHKEALTYKNQKSIAERRLHALEKMIPELDNEEYSRSSKNPSLEKYKSTISILLRQNQESKRENNLNRRIKEQNANKIKRMETIVSRLTDKLELQKTNSTTSSTPSQHESRPKKQKTSLSSSQIEPQGRSIEYRLEAIPKEHRDIIQELITTSGVGWVEYLNTLDEDHQKERITIVCDQYISLREFTQRLTALVSGTIEANKCISLFPDLSRVLQMEFAPFLKCEMLVLWLYDETHEEIVSGNNMNEEVRFPLEGHFRDCLKMGEYCRSEAHSIDDKVLQYYRAFDIDLVDSSLYPLKDKEGKTIAFIESCNSTGSEFDEDDDFLTDFVAESTSTILSRIIKSDLLDVELKMKDQLLESTGRILSANNLADLSARINTVVQDLFGVQRSKFIFVENAQMVIYSDDSRREVMDITATNDRREVMDIHSGVCSEIVTIQRKQVIKSITTHPSFNFKSDIESQLPVVFYPIVEVIEGTPHVRGVLQWTKKFIAKKMTVKMARLDAIEEALANHLSHLIVIVLKSLRSDRK